MKSILDPSFRYTASFDTDIRRTFARIREDRRVAEEKEATPPLHAPAKVSSIVRKTSVVRT